MFSGKKKDELFWCMIMEVERIGQKQLLSCTPFSPQLSVFAISPSFPCLSSCLQYRLIFLSPFSHYLQILHFSYAQNTVLQDSSAKPPTNSSIICAFCWGVVWDLSCCARCCTTKAQSTDFLQWRVSSLKILWFVFGCKLFCGTCSPWAKAVLWVIGKMWMLHWSTLIPMMFQRQNIESIFNQNWFYFFIISAVSCSISHLFSLLY